MLLTVFATVFLLTGYLQETDAEERRTISVEVTVPDPAWTVQIKEIYVAKDRLLVVSRLSRDPRAIAAQVISKTTDSVRQPLPDLPVEHYILGKTFRWEQEPHHYLENRRELKEKIKDARLVYRQKE